MISHWGIEPSRGFGKLLKQHRPSRQSSPQASTPRRRFVRGRSISARSLSVRPEVSNDDVRSVLDASRTLVRAQSGLVSLDKYVAGIGERLRGRCVHATCEAWLAQHLAQDATSLLARTATTRVRSSVLAIERASSEPAQPVAPARQTLSTRVPLLPRQEPDAHYAEASHLHAHAGNPHDFTAKGAPLANSSIGAGRRVNPSSLCG